MPTTPLPAYHGDHRKKVIGYVRASTPDQAPDLDRQADRIKQACDQRGMVPVAIYEDEASGMNPNALTRDGLRDALGEAKRQQVPLVVADRNRISRVDGEAERIVREHGVCIVCIEDGFLPLSELPSKGSQRGERFAEKVADRTKKALVRRKEKGVQLGSPNLPAVRRLAAIARRVAFDDLVREMVRVLRVEDPTAKLTAREVVDLFNLSCCRF